MNNSFSIKSYLTFLSRNKAYTAINVFGLTISLMFVILIGLFVWQETAVDRQHSKADHTFAVCLSIDENGQKLTGEGCHHIIQRHLRQLYPDVENTCGVTDFEVVARNGDEKVRTQALVVDSTFFSIFDFRLLEGDPKTCLTTPNGIVISQRTARRFYGSQPALGQVFVCGDTTRFRVTGVVENLENSIFANSPEVLLPFRDEIIANYAMTDDGFEHNSVNLGQCSVFVLMREGTTLMGREQQVTRQLMAGPWSSMHDAYKSLSFSFVPLSQLYMSSIEHLNTNLRAANTTLIRVLGAAGIAILIFSLMNYINLTVALSGKRTREMAARRLFGCSRRGIVAHTMAESLSLCVCAFILAVLLAWAFAPTFGQMTGTKMQLSLLLQPSFVATLLSGMILTGVVSGLIPALVSSRVKPIEILRGTLAHRTKMLFSRVFIVIQNVITITMLAAAAVMVLQVRHLLNKPMGYSTDNVVVLSSFGNNPDAFIKRLQAEPQVKNITPSLGTPLDGGNNNTLPGDKKGTSVAFQIIVCEPALWDVFGLKLADGSKPQRGHYYLSRRCIDAVKANAKTFGSPQTLLHHAGFYRVPDEAQYGGTFDDIALLNAYQFDRPMIIYVADKVDEPWSISVKLQGDPVEGYNRIAEIYKESFHETMPTDDNQFADQTIRKFYEQHIRTSQVVSVFAFVAIVISVLGLVAMSTYYIEQRQREVALRKVFGSTSSQVGRRLIGTFLMHVVIAFVVAVPLFLYLMNDWMSQFSDRIGWWPWLVAASGLAVLLLSYVAVLLQSHSAANENPVLHIKDE